MTILKVRYYYTYRFKHSSLSLLFLTSHTQFRTHHHFQAHTYIFLTTELVVIFSWIACVQHVYRLIKIELSNYTVYLEHVFQRSITGNVALNQSSLHTSSSDLCLSFLPLSSSNKLKLWANKYWHTSVVFFLLVKLLFIIFIVFERSTHTHSRSRKGCSIFKF